MDGSTAFKAGYFDLCDDCLGVDANGDRAEPEFLYPRDRVWRTVDAVVD